MNILIITIAFPPRNSPGAQRPYSWAKYWSRAGHRVTVLTIKKERTKEFVKLTTKKDRDDSFKICEVDCSLGKFITPGLMSGPKISPDQENKGMARTVFLNRMLKGYFGALFDMYIPYIPNMIKAGLQMGKQEKYDFMISTYSPPTSHWVAMFFQKRLKIPWVVDFRDIWADVESGTMAALNQWMEGITIAKADLLTIVSEPLRREYTRRYRLPCLTLENGFDPDEVDQLDRARLFPEDGKLRFVYTGAIYGKRDPSPLLAALGSLIKTGKLAKQSIELIFYGRNLDHLINLAGSYGLAEVIKLQGLVERDIALRAQRDADGLIFLESEDYAVDGMLTSKIFEYFRSQRPVLGIGVSPNSTVGRLMVDAGVGFPLGTDSEAIKDFISTNFIDHKSPEIHPNWKIINQFSREILAHKALTYFKTIIKTR